MKSSRSSSIRSTEIVCTGCSHPTFDFVSGRAKWMNSSIITVPSWCIDSIPIGGQLHNLQPVFTERSNDFDQSIESDRLGDIRGRGKIVASDNVLFRFGRSHYDHPYTAKPRIFLQFLQGL